MTVYTTHEKRSGSGHKALASHSLLPTVRPSALIVHVLGSLEYMVGGALGEKGAPLVQLWESPHPYWVRLFKCGLLGKEHPHPLPMFCKEAKYTHWFPQRELRQRGASVCCWHLSFRRRLDVAYVFPLKGILATEDILESNRNISVHGEVKNKKVNRE